MAYGAGRPVAPGVGEQFGEANPQAEQNIANIGARRAAYGRNPGARR